MKYEPKYFLFVGLIILFGHMFMCPIGTPKSKCETSVYGILLFSVFVLFLASVTRL